MTDLEARRTMHEFLDRVDRALNGHAVVVRQTVADPGDRIASVVTSPTFADALLRAFEERGWTAGGDAVEVVVPGADPAVTEMPADQAASRLASLLSDDDSPHQHQLDASTAEAAVEAFLVGVLGDDWRSGWRFYDVAPSFLFSSGYYGRGDAAGDGQLAYFDGGAFDSCTVMVRGSDAIVLLTSGAP